MTNRGQTPSLAVPIDADNTSARYAQAIFEEIVKFGEANVRRIYGDFSGSRLAKPSAKEPQSRAVKLIAKAIEDADEDGWANLGSVGSRIQAAAPDFDSRTYGCSNLSTLVEKSGGFEIRKEPGKGVHIRRKAAKRKAVKRETAGA